MPLIHKNFKYNEIYYTTSRLDSQFMLMFKGMRNLKQLKLIAMKDNSVYNLSEMKELFSLELDQLEQIIFDISLPHNFLEKERWLINALE